MEGRIQGALSCLGNWVSQALSTGEGGCLRESPTSGLAS